MSRVAPKPTTTAPHGQVAEAEQDRPGHGDRQAQQGHRAGREPEARHSRGDRIEGAGNPAAGPHVEHGGIESSTRGAGGSRQLHSHGPVGGSFGPGTHQERRTRRPQREREDRSGGGPAPRGRGDHPHGAHRRRQHGHRLRARGDRPRLVGEPGHGPLRVGRAPHQHHRHPGLLGLHRRRPRRACAPPTWPCSSCPGVDGVEVQTEVLWRMAGEEGIARAFFVNKLDRERASYSRTLTQLKAVFGTAVAPLQVPIGAEHQLSGVAQLTGDIAFTYEGGPKGKQGTIPPAVEKEVAALHTALIEAVVETDDSLLERYLEGTEPTGDELVAAMHRGMLEGTAFPVLCGSATRLIGIDRLAQFIVDYGPRPEERPAPPLAEGTALPDSGVVAYVFKTQSDPYVGRIALFRVFRGSDPGGHLARERHPRRVRAHAQPVHHAGQGAPGPGRGARRRHRRRGQARSRCWPATPCAPPASRWPWSRCACPAPPCRWRCSPSPSRTKRSCPWPCSGRSRTTPPSTWSGGPTPTRPSCPAWATPTSRSPCPASPARFGVEVETALPRIPYRETIRGTRRRRGEAQEADRRPRPVRRGLRQVRAPARPAAATSSWTRSGAATSPASTSRRWTRASRRPCRAASWRATRWWTSAPPCTTASTTRSTPTSCPSAWRGSWPSRRPPPR